ncbi:uncharacterized protein LOC113359883 [Papaver somniferum]|uniref:uncharacterized protein LOC113359883 n=1 Tax=Papaver somniferum TaxID=3469 RepID=UPI000E70150C|nr:uncharacterized protein LOC113359883 [Papaver somniferum]
MENGNQHEQCCLQWDKNGQRPDFTDDLKGFGNIGSVLHKTIAICQKLYSFSQQEGEGLYDYLERFHDLLLQCPHHGLDTPRLILILYEGLDCKTATTIESLCGGNFLDKSAEEGYKILHEIAGKIQEWEAREPIRSIASSEGIHRVDNEFEYEAKFYVLTRRLESLERNVKVKPIECITHASSIPSDCTNQRIPSLEESICLFMQATQRSMENLQQQLNELVSQLNERDKGQFSSQIQTHRTGSFEVSTSGAKPTHHVQAVTTLRSGRVIDNHVSDDEENVQERNLPTITQVTPSTETDETEKGNSEISYVPHAPFPQALLPRKKGASPNDILEVFKQVNVNIPLLDAIKQIPSYTKFLRDMCIVKRKLNVHKKAFLAEQVSSIITQKAPPKFKDPGCPTIACTIGEHRTEHALLDLGASVNLLPYFVYVQLELGDLKPTNVTLQLSDRSIKIPMRVVEDIFIQVESFVYPVDFIVLDTQPVSNPCGQIPVILGRPFLATSNAVINCRNRNMELTFGNMKMEINVFSLSNLSAISETCEHVCMVNGVNDYTHCYNENLENMFENFAGIMESCDEKQGSYELNPALWQP